MNDYHVANDNNSVAFESATLINIWGKKAQRFMAVYRTRGCAYDRSGKGCTMCNFSHYAVDNIQDENISKQHQQILKILDKGKFNHFDLLTLGNFFNDDEISPKLRKILLQDLSKLGKLSRILVESRYEYITEQKLLDAKSYLRNDQILEFALGYESMTEEIRNTLLNKAVKEEHLDNSLQLCKKCGLDFVAYVLIKPHTLSEQKGIIEASETAIHVLKKAIKYGVNARIAFEPVFVTHHKVIETYFLNGQYTPPKLWSITEVLRLTIDGMGKDFKKGSLFVGLNDEYLSGGRFSHNCGVCDPDVTDAIEDFNGSQNITDLNKLKCACKPAWEALIKK